MKIKLLVISALLVTASCGNTETEKTNETEINTPTSADDLASIISGEFEGVGNYSTKYSSDFSFDFTSILVQKQSNTSVNVSSPTHTFPNFMIENLVDRPAKILGTIENGSMSFDKKNNKFDVLLKGYSSDSIAFSFEMN